jgi:hypothetical protein
VICGIRSEAIFFQAGCLGVGFGRRPFQRPDQKMATRITIIMAIKAT